MSIKLNIDLSIINAVNIFNQKRPLKIVSKISKYYDDNLKNKTLTILGLSFKPNTDDIRDSSSLIIAKELLNKGAKLKVNDPKAMKNTETIFKYKITYADSVLKSLDNCHCVVIMTPWKIYTKLKNNNFKNMKKKLIIDTRRILSGKNLNVEYFALGMGN